MLPEQEIATLFYQATNKRPDRKQMAQTITQARILLKRFTQQEIEQGIRYCSINPPARGFFSIMWLSHALDEILTKLRVEQIKEEQKYYPTTMQINSVVEKREVIKPKQRVSSEFDFDMFKEDSNGHE